MIATLLAVLLATTFQPPPDAKHFCGGHVTGAGSPGPHIVWDAYAARQSRNAVSTRYKRLLGTPSHSNRSCDTWRDDEDKPVHVLTVCEVDADGPWSQCTRPKRGSIVMLSTMARPE